MIDPYPFPHLVSSDVFSPNVLDAVRAEIPPSGDPGWRRFGNDREAKFEGGPHLWGDATRRYFEMLASGADLLAELFGLPELHMETVGGGFHLIPPGGYLAVHSDFSRSPHTGRYRRLNVITYLNENWTDDGGHLELWDDRECVVSVAPEFATTVAFVTSSTSWHGHPKPAERWRASVAAYFFTDDPPDGFVEQSTVWHPAV